ncbi:hypothetical protein J1N35_044125 [Gossypium stocksii]|uniref:Uncharacterized protein n=1 Tax=Gossypium stocksii TaxID=47602 RepID=A0A9D3U8X3_9ROSI|nr:hypothetical protein J1N35_044125 [Gossypium stocksii]
MFNKASIKMTKGINEKIETREIVEGKKANKSRDMISALEVRDDVLKAVVLTLKEQIEELKGELTIYRVVLGNRMLVVVLKTTVDNTKLKEFKGMRSAKDMDNFLWGME